MNYPYRLLAPGPVPVPEQVLKKMSEKVLHHRTPEFEKILCEVWEGLKYVFKTKQPVQILCGTGTSAMEAAVVNLLSPGDHALVIISGKFGERWAEICECYGISVHKLNTDWGSPVDPKALEQALTSNPNVKVVFSQVCETSTATVHPIQELAKIVKKHGRLFALDAITAVGCMNLPMDEWELDAVIAGSQKAFMIPTGLSFIALSERAWRNLGQAPKFYFDLSLEKKANSKNETHFSTPTPLIVGLHEVLTQMQSHSLEQVIKRCEILAQVTREFGLKLGLKTFSKAPSSSVTALLTSTDSSVIQDWLERERAITIMGGQDHLKGKILRIGHMGDVKDDDMIALFLALSEKIGTDFTALKQDLATRLKSVRPLF